MSNLNELKKQYEKLGKEIEKLEKVKTWPDSFEKALEESMYWGIWIDFISCPKKYMLVSNGSARGYILCCKGTADLLSETNNWFKNNGLFDGFNYYIKKFDTARDLYLWMAEED